MDGATKRDFQGHPLDANGQPINLDDVHLISGAA